MQNLQEEGREVRGKKKSYRRRSRELLKRLKEKYGFKSRKDLEDYLSLVEADFELQLLKHAERKSREKSSYIV